jgi:hypothetical protein
MMFTARSFMLPTTRWHAHLPRWMLSGFRQTTTEPICDMRVKHEMVEGGALRPLCRRCLERLGNDLKRMTAMLDNTIACERRGGYG